MNEEKQKLLIVMDLDETLLFTKLIRKDSYIKEEGNFCIDLEDAKYTVFIRPGAKELIEYCQQNYYVGIWSSAKLDYVERLVEILFDTNKLEFVKHRKDCEIIEDKNFESPVVKNLNKLSYPIEKILVIDDDATTARFNLKNLIQVSIFRDNLDSNDLFVVLDEIKSRSFFDDVRM